MLYRTIGGFGIVMVLGCCATTAHSRDNGSVPSPQRQCAAAREPKDSSYAVAVASRALRDRGSVGDLRISSFERRQDGFLITLENVSPEHRFGGSGLLWVDGESGCAILLHAYE